MALNPDLLRSSFEVAISQEVALTHRFYEIFFSRYPVVVPMFSRNAPEKQQQMLQQTLLAVLDHLDDSAWLTTQLHALGAGHVAYGVEDHMYGWVGESLIAAMKELSGQAWTPEIEAQWAEAYGILTSLALEGAARARAQS